MELQRGARIRLDSFHSSQEIEVMIEVSGKDCYDYCCFGVNEENRLSDDRYMVFYNQPRSPGGEIVWTQTAGGAKFVICLDRLPASVNKLVFTVSIDGNGSMGMIASHTLTLRQGARNEISLRTAGSDFQDEKAIISVEIYRKDVWRLAAVARGFNGGLGDLLRAYGGEEMESDASATRKKVSLEKRLQQEAPQLVSLAKPLKVELEKHSLQDCAARVALVMDISGSMTGRYQNGTVQEIVNKTLPLAVQFDDDGELDFWYYGSRPKRQPSVNLRNYQSAVPRNWASLMKELGYGNNEPKVMKEVLSEYRGTRIPAYVIFVTDGGVGSEREIKKLLTEASHFPIFWQFVGVGGSGYGVLKRLDNMSGRYVDNANFFALDDFRKVSSSDLYRRLLNEFPSWLREIRAKGML